MSPISIQLYSFELAITPFKMLWLKVGRWECCWAKGMGLEVS
ncbi:hypothetical protein [Aestuariispira insulae]|uniref:Uncharacterized protein n=1 Tax=Aestuariispira insulae TaxID=1461337 RepID=A0A3D9HVP1_9PROT|nr:hypothetical protein [Aestuariispira insulae]RED53489.1 hypothetical protein DFP90_101278 [Aestuariispira insulae]